MEKQIVNSSKLPASVGPYSPMVRCGNLLFISGQISVDVATGKVIVQNVAEQTRTIMEIIKHALEETGSSMDKVIKCTVHLSDIKHFDQMNQVYASYFPNGYPARLCVSGVQLYDGVDVEIDVIAAV